MKNIKTRIHGFTQIDTDLVAATPRRADPWQTVPLLRGARTILAWIGLSLFLGIASNALREKPLPLVYQTPKERLRASIQKIAPTLQALPGQPLNREPGTVEPHPEIEPQQAGSLVGDPSVLFLDARTYKLYKAGHIPGALSAPRKQFHELLPGIFPRLVSDKVRLIVIYCSGGDCDDSRTIAEILAEMNLNEIRVLKGGWEAWEAAGLKVER